MIKFVIDEMQVNILYAVKKTSLNDHFDFESVNHTHTHAFTNLRKLFIRETGKKRKHSEAHTHTLTRAHIKIVFCLIVFLYFRIVFAAAPHTFFFFRSALRFFIFYLYT